MSWSVEYTSQKNAEIQFYGDDTPEVNEAMKAAVDAVGTIVESGVLGDPAKKHFSVRISGHTNPGHEPVPGWANDSLTINVYQMEEE